MNKVMPKKSFQSARSLLLSAFILMLLFFMLLFTQAGCTLPPDPNEEAFTEEQELFLSWSRPLLKEIKKSDDSWILFSKTLVFYVEEIEEDDDLEEIALETVALNRELMDFFSVSVDNEEEQLINDLSYQLCAARLKVSELVLEDLAQGRMPDLDDEVYKETRNSTETLAMKYEEIMKQHGVVWAHLRFY